MIVWLSSYPKSGNTYLRALISAYIFTNDGEFNFNLLKNFIQFPNYYIFEQLKINKNNQSEILKNYSKAQEFISKLGNQNSIQFVKTHSGCMQLKNQKFLDFKTTLGAIYIVRDPRNVVTSYAKHYQKSNEEASFDLISDLTLGVNSKTHPPTYVGTWGSNYQSWKRLETTERYLLIRYEDMLADPEKILLKVLNFIYNLSKSKFLIDKIKLKNVLYSTKFEKMEKLEKEIGFHEANINKADGKKIKFFNLGKNNNWKNILKDNLVNKIENSFKKEMIELNYL